MTILCLADVRFPLGRANGTQTMETCAALAARGNDVHLLVRPDTRVPARDPLAYYGLPPNPRLRIERTPVFGPPGARRAAYLAGALARLLERRWDVVFTRDLGVADVALRWPARMRPPIVYESHGFAAVLAATRSEIVSGARSAGPFKIGRLWRRERRVWRAAGGYAATTGVLAADLRQRFGSRPRVAVVPNGVRLRPGRAYADAGRSGTPTVAYAGHFYPWKGAGVLVEALASLPRARGLFIGGRPGESDAARLRALACSRGLRERVTFTGPVPPAGVAALLAGADVLALPTVATPHARHTSPLKLFEYMAAGRPIVASDLLPLREIVEHRRTAFLVAPGDPEALAAGVRSVLDDRPLAARMARAAFGRAADYSWERRAERLERLFRDVAAAAAQGGAAGGPPREPTP